jgi:MraZ protein
LFHGRHDHTIDGKGRLSVPKDFREELATRTRERRSEKPPMLIEYDDHLRLYPYPDWEDMVRNLDSKSNLQVDVQDFERLFVGGAMECAVDPQGRILVPPHMRTNAKLEGKVTLTGVRNKIEIWNTEQFEAKKRSTLGRWAEVQQNVDQGSNAKG